MNEKELIEFQHNLITMQIQEEWQKDFISDRSLIDMVAYSCRLPLKEYLKIKNRVKVYLKHYPYDYLFYTPIEFEMEKD
jgi:hypothetical protein